MEGTEAATTAEGGIQLPQGAFRLLGEAEVPYSRFLQVEDRQIEYPDGRRIAFDIVGHQRTNFHFVTIFAFDTRQQTVTVLSEFAQAALPHSTMVWSLPCGGYEPRKHTSAMHAAERELSEEAHLTGGQWRCLLPEGHPGVLEAKWCRNRFTPFLCIDPITDEHPGGLDPEEHLAPMAMPIARLRQVLLEGEMLLPSVQTCISALAALEEAGLLAPPVRRTQS